MAPSATAPVDFKALFEKSSGLFLILDPQLRVVAATDAYCRAIRLPREAMLGEPLLSLFPGHESNPDSDAFDKLKESIERVLRLNRPDTMETMRYDLPRPDGSGFETRYWSPRNSPIFDAQGNVRWIAHRVFDVTAAENDPEAIDVRRRLEQNQELVIAELRRSNEELARLDALRNDLLQMSRLNTMAMMASAMAHDVSQPLTAAKNYLSALKRSRDDVPKSDDLIAKLAQQIDRASEIVKTLRGFMAAGSTAHKPESVRDVVEGAARLAESVIKVAGARLIVEVDPELPPVRMDRVQIQQVILNLVTNAAEAVSDQPVREIRIVASTAGPALCVDVSDTGRGLPKEVEQYLSEPMNSTGLMRMGLGLPISRQIVKEHDGAFWVKPNQPQGAVFSFSIALDAAPEAAQSA